MIAYPPFFVHCAPPPHPQDGQCQEQADTILCSIKHNSYQISNLKIQFNFIPNQHRHWEGPSEPAGALNETAGTP